MTMPEQGNMHPEGLTAGNEQGVNVRGVPETERENLIPLASHYDLARLPNEAASIDRLSPLVTVERGVARLFDPEIGVTTSLVAVRIKDNEAEILPFVMEDEALLLPSPPDGFSLGLFIGHDGEMAIDSVIRQGDDPSVPLVTVPNGLDRQKEIPERISGLNANDVDVTRWAESVRLFEQFGFIPSKTNFLSKSFNPNPHDPDSEWQTERIAVVPERLAGVVKRFDSGEVAGDRMQVLTCVVEKPAVKKVPSFFLIEGATENDPLRSIAADLGQSRPRSMLLKATPDPAESQGVRFGFTPGASHKASTGSVTFTHINAAFNFRIVPKK